MFFRAILPLCIIVVGLLRLLPQSMQRVSHISTPVPPGPMSSPKVKLQGVKFAHPRLLVFCLIHITNTGDLTDSIKWFSNNFLRSNKFPCLQHIILELSTVIENSDEFQTSIEMPYGWNSLALVMQRMYPQIELVLLMSARVRERVRTRDASLNCAVIGLQFRQHLQPFFEGLKNIVVYSGRTTRF